MTKLIIYWCHFYCREEKEEGIEVKSSPVKTSPPASPEARPVERQVEARNPEDSISSMVRCLYFATTYISDGESSGMTCYQIVVIWKHFFLKSIPCGIFCIEHTFDILVVWHLIWKREHYEWIEIRNILFEILIYFEKSEVGLSIWIHHQAILMWNCYLVWKIKYS